MRGTIPALLMLCASLQATAGGELDDSEERAAAAAVLKWRKAGASNLKPVLRAACSHSSEAMRAGAKGLLAEWGAPALKAVLASLERASKAEEFECLDEWYETAARTLCEAGVPSEEPVEGEAFTRNAPKLEPLLKLLGDDLRAGKAPRADNALEIVATASGIEIDPARSCSNLGALLDSTANAAMALGAEPTAPDRRKRRLEILGDYGAQAAPAVPSMIALLSDLELQLPAVELLGAIGPAAMPASPALTQLLGTEIGVPAATALGHIGGPAALTALVEAATHSLETGCARPLPFSELALPLAMAGGAEVSSAADVTALLAHGLDRCPEQEVATLKAIALLGGRRKDLTRAPSAEENASRRERYLKASEGLETTLLAAVRDREETVSRRDRYLKAAEAFGAPFSPSDRAIATALHAKSERRTLRPAPTQVMPQEPEGETEEARRVRLAVARVRHGLDVCRQLNGLETPLVALDGAPEKLNAVSGCLEERLCAPDRETYAADVSACCAQVYGEKAPSWCSP